MPIYDYQCRSCGHNFELKQSFDSDPESACPLCAGRARRRFGSVGIIYKGSGFYTTDYTQKNYSGPSSEGAPPLAEESKKDIKAGTSGETKGTKE